MEGELWPGVYQLIRDEGNRHPRKQRVQFSDAYILTVYMWAVTHDRPVSWACKRKNWPAGDRDRNLPSSSTMSDRLKTLSLRLLLQAIMDRLAALGESALVRRLDSKPLPVSAFSKDRDARWGQAVDAKARGYKLFCCWGAGVMPDAWVMGPMNRADPDAGVELVPQLQGCAYVLGDATHDSNPLHAVCTACGGQLIAPRKKPQTELGHCRHEPGRLRSIALLESSSLSGTEPSAFAKSLYAMRADIERRYGNLCVFGGGLQPLPSWVRTPHRVVLWVAAKLVINGVRQCKIKGLAA